MKNVFLEYLWSLNEKAKYRKFRDWIILMIIIICLGFVLGFVVSRRSMKEAENPEKEVGADNNQIVTTVDTVIEEEPYVLTIDTIRETLMPASELISTKYFYTDVDTYENYKELWGKKVPFTTDKVVFTYDGIISVGIDMTELVYEVDNEQKQIFITLPELKILANEIDEKSFTFPYVSDSIFNGSDMTEYLSLISRLEEEKEKEILDNAEFMNTARANTRMVLKDFLLISEATEGYDVIFK